MDLVAPRLSTRLSVLRWHDNIVGTAREILRADSFVRDETIAIRRRTTHVRLSTRVELRLDAQSTPDRIEVRQRQGRVLSVGIATRTPDGRDGNPGWQSQWGQEAIRNHPAACIPIEWVHVVIEKSEIAAPTTRCVLLSGYGFARARLRTLRSPGRVDFVLSTQFGDARYYGVVNNAGQLVQIVGPGPMHWMRMGRRPSLPVVPPDIVTSSAMRPISMYERSDGMRFELRSTARAFPALAEQQIRRKNADVIEITTTAPRWPKEHPDAHRISATTHKVSDAIADSLTPAAPQARPSYGDCTTHARALYRELRTAGYRTRIVTGYRFDADRLWRHRWVAVWLAGAWHHLDPSYGEAPARSTWGLAMHGSDHADISLADAIVFLPFAPTD